MDRILLIVDPQVDFISGSLAVPGAVDKMNALVGAMREGGELNNYDYVIITKDSHPLEHCSFVDNGGRWPKHCVQNTRGCDVYHPVWEVANSYDMDVFTKGECPSKEEYSVFENEESSSILEEILLDFDEDPANEIRVTGIAGDYCVLSTLEDLIDLGYKDHIVVDTRFIASIDGGRKLDRFIKTNNLRWV